MERANGLRLRSVALGRAWTLLGSRKRNENYLGCLFIYLRSLSDIAQDRIRGYFPIMKYVAIDAHESNK